MKTVGIATIHGICNFGSLLQAYATQATIERLGYKSFIINYKYPNEYHVEEYKKQSPYANNKINFALRLRLALYSRTCREHNLQKKQFLFAEERKRLLHESELFETKESLQSAPPQYDIYLTGSDQVWNPRYMRGDNTFFLDFVHDVPKVAFSASFGTTVLSEVQKVQARPLLNEYLSISLREQSGVGMVKEICGKEANCTCDPTLLLSGEEWAAIFNDKPIIKGEYILCYILTYTADPYPYASKLIRHLQKHLKKKVVVLDESGRYWMDFRYKSFRSYGPRQIVNLFKYASFIVSSSFHGAVFSINFQKDFYSLFLKGINDERQESLLKLVGAESRFIRVGDPLPDPSSFKIQNWKEINEKLRTYRDSSILFLKQALDNATKFTK